MPRTAAVPRQLLWFMLVGAVSTVVQTIVYVAAREIVPALWASWMALLVVTPINTELHRRVTFGVRVRAIGRLHGEAGLTSVAVYLANLATAPWFAGFAGPDPSALIEALILALTGSVIGGARYLVLRGWVFALHRHEAAHDSQVSEPAPPWSPHDHDRAPHHPEPIPAPDPLAVTGGFTAGRRCRAAAGSRLRGARRSPAGRRCAGADQRPAGPRATKPAQHETGTPAGRCSGQ